MQIGDDITTVTLTRPVMNNEFIAAANTTNGASTAVIPVLNVAPVPTVSEWGLVVLALLLLTGAKMYFGRRRDARTAA